MNTAQLLNQFHNKQAKLADGLQVIKAGRKIMDVFIGQGWKNHSRYRNVLGKWMFVSGKELPAVELNRAVLLLRVAGA